MCEWGVYLWCSLCTLCLLAWQVRVTVGDSGLCGGVCDVIGTLISRGVQFSSVQFKTVSMRSTPSLRRFTKKKKKKISIHFLGPSPILLSLSFSFLGIEEGTCRFKVADSRTGSADVLALPNFTLFFVSLFFFPLRQPSPPKLVFCYIFHSLCCLLFSLFF